MIDFELLRDAGVLIVAPKGALTAEDFRAVASTVDPYISENGKLTGLLIEAPSFPGWDSLGALIEHISSRPPPQHRTSGRGYGQHYFDYRAQDSRALRPP
jgi:hypothetical protein